MSLEELITTPGAFQGFGLKTSSLLTASSTQSPLLERDNALWLDKFLTTEAGFPSTTTKLYRAIAKEAELPRAHAKDPKFLPGAPDLSTARSFRDAHIHPGPSSSKLDLASSTQQAKYDPWRDIFQRGDFETNLLETDQKMDRSTIIYYEEDYPEEYYLEDEADPPKEEPLNEPQYQREEEQLSKPKSRYPPRVGSRRQDSGDQQPQRRRRPPQGKEEAPYDFLQPDDYYEFSNQLYDEDGTAIDRYQAGDHPSDQLPSPSLTRRVANFIFSPSLIGIFTVVGVPLLIAALYWLFVVNGPTPVVRARSEEDASPDGGPGFLEDLVHVLIRLGMEHED